MSGSGVLILTATNTYSGATTVSTGTLVLAGNNSGAVGATTVSSKLQLAANSSNGGTVAGGTNTSIGASSALTLNNGSTLQLRSDVNTTFQPLGTTVASGATVTMNVDQLSSGTNGALILGATTTFAGAATLNVTGGNGYTLGLPNVLTLGSGGGGTVTFSPSSGATLNIGALSGSATYSVFSFAGAGTTNVTGAITQLAGNRSDALIFNQTGTVKLSGNSNLRNNSNVSDNANTYIDVSSGTTDFNSTNAIYSDYAAPLNLKGGAIDNTSGGAITLAGVHAITISADFTFGGTNDLNLGNNAVTLSGTTPNRTITTNGSAILTLPGAISGTAGLIKAGPGTLSLPATNTYSGITAVNGGLLQVTGTLTNTSAVSISSGTMQLTGVLSGTSPVAINGGGALVTGSGTLSGAMTIAGGADSSTQGTLNLANNSAGTLTLGGLTVGDPSSGAALIKLDAGGSAADLIALGANTFTVNTGGAAFSFNDLGGLSAGQTFNLITFGSGAGAGFATGSGVTVGGLTLANTTLSFGVTGSLEVSSTAVQLVTGGIAAPATAYWSGAQGSQWTATDVGMTAGNFTTDQAGTTAVTAYPAASSDVFFGATGATQLANTLGQNFAIKSLNFLAGTGAVTIGGTNMLTVESGGINIENGAGQVTVSSNMALGSSQTWTNNSADPLTVSGAISGTGSLTATAGSIVLSSSNSYSGGTTIASGSLKIGNSASLGATTAPLAVNGGTLDLNGKSPTVGVFSGSTGAVITTTASGTATFTAGGSANTVFDGQLSDGGSGQVLRFVKSGPGSLALTGFNSYSGGTSINSGTLQVASSGALGTGAVGINATLDLNGQTVGNAFTNATGSVITNNSASTAYVTSGFNLAGAALFTISDLTISGTGDIVWSGAFARNNGLGTLTKAGDNTLFMSGTSVYGGMNLTVNGGRVVYGKTIGGAVTFLAINSGTLQMDPNYQVTTANIWSGFIGNEATINGGTWDLNDTAGINNRLKRISGTGGVITNSGTGTALLYIAPRDTAAPVWSGNIQDGPNGGKVAVYMQQGGTFGQVETLSGSNSYSGTTVFWDETLRAGSTTAFSPNSGFTVQTNATLDLNNYNNSVGSLAGSGTVLTGTGAGGILTAGGNSTSTTYSGVISGNGGLTKAGTGTFILSNTSTYAGATTVNGGTLSLTGGLTGDGAIAVNSGTLSVSGRVTGNGGVAVNNGGTLSLNGVALSGTGGAAINGGGTLVGTGTIAGAVTVAGGSGPSTQGTINMQNGSYGTLTLGGLTVGDATTGTSLLNFEVGDGASDLISLGSNAFTANAGGAVVKISGIGALNAGDVFNLITFTNGSAPSGITLDPTTTQLGFNTGSLILSASAVQLTLSGPAAPVTAYFTGAYSPVWNGSDGGTNANFTTDSAGTTNTHQLPGPTSNVILASDAPSTGVTALGQNFSIASLTFTAAGASVTGSNTLTIGSGGITIDSDNAGATISTTGVVLGANQAWTNNSVSPMAVSANVSGTGALRINGNGGLILSGSNTYSGGTTLNGGTLQLGSSFALGASTGALALNSGTLDMNGYNPTVGAFSGSSGVIVTSVVSGTGTLTAGDASNTTFAGILTDSFYGKVAFTKSGSGTLVFTGANSYSGPTSVNSGTLQAGVAGAFGGSTVTINGGALDLNGFAPTNVLAVGAAANGSKLVNSNTNAVVVSNDIAVSSNFTVNTTGDITATRFIGQAAIRTLTKEGPGTLTTNGGSHNNLMALVLNAGTVVFANTSGYGADRGVTINGGTLRLSGANTNLLNDGYYVAVNGGTFDLNGKSETIGALSGSAGGVITNSGSTTSTLTVTGAGTYGGTFQDGAAPLAVTMTFTGTSTLSGSNSFTGASMITNGVVVLANSDALRNTALNITTSGQSLVFDSSVSSHAFTVGSLANTAGSFTTLSDNAGTPNAVTLTVGGNNGSTTYLGNLLGLGSLVKTGTGTMTLTGTNLYAGTTTVSQGVLAIGGSTASLAGYNVSGQVSVASGAELRVAMGTGKWQPNDLGSLMSNVNFASNSTLGIDTTAGDVTVSGSNVVLSGSIALNKAGTNMLTLTGSNSYSGGSTVNAGTLAVGGDPIANSHGLGTGNVIVSSGAQLRLGVLVTSNTNVATIANNITLAGATIFVDDAWQHLSGTINVTAASTLGSTYNGGSNSVGERDKGLFLDGVVTGTAALTLQQSGINTNHTYNSSMVYFTNNANTYSGTLTVNPMTSANSGGSYVGISATGALQFASIVLNGNNTKTNFGTSPIVFKSGLGAVSLGSIGGSGNVVLTGYDEINHVYGTDAVALTVGANNANTTLSGAVSGSGSIAKTGAGTFILSGSNSHSGGTAVNAGTLQVGSINALGTGGLTVNGGTLDLAGYNPSVPAFSGSGGTVTNSNAAGTSTLTATIASGTSSFAGNIANGAGGVALTKEGTGKLILSGSLSMAGLNANNGATELTQSGSIAAIAVSGSATLSLTAHTGAYKVLDTNSLSITTGGNIDLWNNAMIVAAADKSTNSANLVSIKAQVNTASNSLQWNGTGIGSTTAFNEAQPSHTQALALMVYDNTVITQSSFEGVSGLGYFDGSSQAQGFNQVLVKLTYLGDFNADGVVNASDYTWLDGYALGANPLGDLNGDGVVNATDYTWLDGSALNQSFGVLATQKSGDTTPLAPVVAAAPAGTGALTASPEAVPEPGVFSLLLTGALGLLGRRTRKQNKSRNS